MLCADRHSSCRPITLIFEKLLVGRFACLIQRLTRFAVHADFLRRLVCVCVGSRICIRCIYTDGCMCMCMCVVVCVYVCVYICICIYICVCAHGCVCRCVCARALCVLNCMINIIAIMHPIRLIGRPCRFIRPCSLLQSRPCVVPS